MSAEEVSPPAKETTRPVITQEVVTSKFNLELTRNKYQEALQSLTSYNITRDNINEAQEKMKKARKFLTVFKTIYEEKKKPSWDEYNLWLATYNNLKAPFEKLIAEKTAVLTKISNELEKERIAAANEKTRIDNVKTKIDNFILSVSQQIAEASSDDQLVSLEKLIGSHKANKSRYQEFLPDFITRCNELTPILKKQKEAVRKIEELKKQEQEALASGDDQKVLDSQESQEAVQATISENKVVVQETAINQAIAPEITHVEVLAPTISARRTSWKAELLPDAKSLKKAFDAGMLDCELNSEKAKTTLNALKDAGTLKGLTEYTLNGVRYFEQKLF